VHTDKSDVLDARLLAFLDFENQIDAVVGQLDDLWIAALTALPL